MFGCICSLRKQISPAGSGQKAREERLREDDKHYREQEREGRKAEEEADQQPPPGPCHVLEHQVPPGAELVYGD